MEGLVKIAFIFHYNMPWNKRVREEFDRMTHEQRLELMDAYTNGRGRFFDGKGALSPDAAEGLAVYDREWGKWLNEFDADVELGRGNPRSYLKENSGLQAPTQMKGSSPTGALEPSKPPASKVRPKTDAVQEIEMPRFLKKSQAPYPSRSEMHGKSKGGAGKALGLAGLGAAGAGLAYHAYQQRKHTEKKSR